VRIIATSRRATTSRTLRDGTPFIVGGSLLAGFAAYGYEVVGGRHLGAEGFAPAAALLTIHFLAFVIVLLPLEQVVIRRLTIDPMRPAIPVGVFGIVAATAVLGAGAGWVLRGRLFGGDPVYAFIIGATIVSHGIFAVARGHLAGSNRYRTYGVASATAALTRLGLAFVVLGATASAAGYAATLAVAPLMILGLRPFRATSGMRQPTTGIVDIRSRETPLLAGLMLGSAASQALLLAGPVVVALLGGGPVAVSTAFATFTLLRAPVSLGYNVVARILPPLTGAARTGDERRLRLWGWGLAGASTALAMTAAAGAAWLGPDIVAFLFGAGFRPPPEFAALIAAGVMLAAGSMFVGQVHVAANSSGRLAHAWLLALLATATLLALPLGDPLERVAVAFVAGEAVALIALTVAIRGQRRTAPERHATGTVSYPVLKRLVDLAVASSIVIVTAPLAAAAAVAVRLDSPGPVLFRQQRIGRSGRSFTIFKFRTMDASADPDILRSHLRRIEAGDRGGFDSPQLAVINDPRVTRVGAFLRRWSLDELPNLWNVVRGEMSLVGPRPLVADEVEVASRVLGAEAIACRHTVPPGMTGLAQIRGRDDIAIRKRSQLDLEYIDARSPALDLWILGETVRTVFRHRGR
jgi:lipopolysaccharide/colanic/teichoic acid biosynthesis glycosyltransferase